ncbi:MAG: hypothetical protein IME94_06665, partial [Proteobacteria bacterium]|nr:hypothetical protein [Pseudomonadota bacterium]
YNADVGKKGAETIEIKELADNQTVESMTLEIEKYQSGKDGVITITAYDKDGNQVGDSMSMDATADDDHKYNYEFNPENGGEFNYISVSVGDDTHIKVKKILADVKTTEEPDSYSYDIDVTVALADTDSSESITEVTISGHDIPDGVKVYQDDTEITANDDGDYLLNANDLSDVNIISPTELLSDGEGGFKLEVTATTTDSGGDSETMTAVLIDGVVEGVEYSTSSGLHGFTDENGGYSFHEGDTITFNVGGVELGSVTAEEAMAGQTFLQDIADVDRSDMNDEHLENMATFLQSIDSDSSDNILITAETRDALANVTLDLNTASEAAVQELVESIGGVYVDEAAAMNHVQDMLEEYTDMESVDFDEHIDDQNENQSTHQLMSATLVVNAIEDISYETSSGLAGDTSKTGTFEYNAGDSITFYDSDGAMISVINAHDIGDDGLITFEEISALSDDFDHNSEYFEDITDTEQTIESEQTIVTDTDDLSEIDVLEFDTSGTTEQELTDAFTQLDVAGSFDVDTSNGWIDATETTLSEDTFSADNVYADSDDPWTLIVNGEETDDQLAVSALNLVADTTGIVNSSEESEVLMDESERIEW